MAFLSEFQTAIYKLLKDNMTVPIFDETPKDQKLPYVVLEDLSVVPLIDKNSSGYEVSIRIEVWSDYKGNKQVNDLVVAIFNILQYNKLELENFNQILVEIQIGDIVKEPDGLTRNGSLIIRYIFY